jgi:hypothetical protein
MAMAMAGCSREEAVVARVNGQPIDRGAYEAEVGKELGRQRRQRPELKAGIEERIRETVLRRMVEDELIAQKAKALGLQGNAARGRDAFEAWRAARFPTPAQWAEYLERTGHTEATLREEQRRNALREEVLEAVARSLSPPGDRRDALDRLQREARVEMPAQPVGKR